MLGTMMRDHDAHAIDPSLGEALAAKIDTRDFPMDGAPPTLPGP